MRFPGYRKRKHFFPVTEQRITKRPDREEEQGLYILGLDQLIVDVEIFCTTEELERFAIPRGGSTLLEDGVVEDLYHYFLSRGLVHNVSAGGAVGNTLHNYTLLSNERAILLGSISDTIHPGDDAFRYLSDTRRHVDLQYLAPKPGPIAKAITFITPDGERSFGVSNGIVNDYDPNNIPEQIVRQASLFVATAFLFRDPHWPIHRAGLRLLEMASAAHVPVVLNLATSSLIEEKRDFLIDLLQQHVSIAAMNLEESRALTGEENPILALNRILEWVDLALVTVGIQGLYIGAHVDEAHRRPTTYELVSKGLPAYNKYEFSRAQLLRHCPRPTRIFTHVHPFMGGPQAIANTSGAGDSAVAALIHDIMANLYHRRVQPDSPKHLDPYLTYSSIHRIGRWANRVSYEVLRHQSPRLWAPPDLPQPPQPPDP